MSVYNRDIRQYIGRSVVFKIKAAVMARNEAGEVLLLKRPGRDVWGLPIGGIKPGESMEEAAARELWEESGHHAGELELLDLLSGRDYVKKHVNGDEEYYVIGVYAAHGLKSVIDLPEESDTSMKYFAGDALPVTDGLTTRILHKLLGQPDES
ncbi:NUDIX hydrolase [Paenibacillus algicola]|uniref:NUDIX hydrolase n=1 Tax=Paenibacillus algicola TaxID=2565926 RepID=A0A4V1G415_9BACL|nr:NUDIX domain-containing protein [Paenibacillus algicola]QCT03114.1 NUDIX hydrolase [Paenibacillus algicola]